MKTVLFITEDEKSLQFRHRVLNVAEAVNGVVKNGKVVRPASWEWRAEWYIKRDIKKALARLKAVDLVVINRQTAKDNVIPGFIRAAHKAQVKVLFDLDDLVFSYQDLRLLKESVQEKSLAYWLGYIWGIRRIAKKADGFITTNEFLGKKLRKSFSKPVRVITNSLSYVQVDNAGKVVKQRSEDDFVIGYFSGTPTHARDLTLVEPGLVKFLDKHENAKLGVVGRMEFSDAMRKLIDEGKVELTSPVDYLKLQSLISRVDVNIAPLVVNDFTNCKSEVKFIEAAAVATTTIASPSFAFKKVIQNGKNGFLCKTDEWYDVLELLYKHPKENQKIAEAARAVVLKKYYGADFLKEVEEAYDYFSK